MKKCEAEAYAALIRHETDRADVVEVGKRNPHNRTAGYSIFCVHGSTEYVLDDVDDVGTYIYIWNGYYHRATSVLERKKVQYHGSVEREQGNKSTCRTATAVET